MKFTPYPFQSAVIADAVKFLRSSTRGAKRCYQGPTGCGKSVVELLTQTALEDCWIVSPREEIIDGMLNKLGAPPNSNMLDYRIGTPITLRNRLMDGRISRPKYLIFDEGHHHTAESWQQLDLLTGLAPSVAFTATAYRGTPKGTREFLEHWGEPEIMISFMEAVAEGYIKQPSFETVPLVDDDLVEVVNGEFRVTSLDGVTVDRLGHMADIASKWYSGGRWDQPTVFSLPSTSTCIRLRDELARRGAPSMLVTAETPKQARTDAFDATAASLVALINIDVVSEGVDFPFRRWVDLAPTMSPVKWVQRMGRVTRPGPGDPVVICTNRNIARHAYIMDGGVPNSAVIENTDRFPPSDRAHTRVLGLEALGRFKPTSAKLADGLTLCIYSLSVPVGTSYVNYCCLIHPTKEPVWAVKSSSIVDGKREYGSWAETKPPTDLRGFSSAAPKALSPKQEAWWQRSAASYGIDPNTAVDRKNFQVLPVLSDLGLRY